MAMGPARMLLAVIVLCWKFNPIENASWTKCDKYEGYSPGGRKSVITPIPSVAVSFDRDAAAAAAAAANFKRSGSIVAASAKIASQLLSSETKKTVSNAVKYFKKTATYLGPSLSIVSALLGFSVRGPTTTELLAKVNEGLDKLRKEINNRLDEMKGYVDNSIIESEKRAMNSHLFEVSKRWSRCASKFTKEAEIKCQEDVADIYSSKEGFFMTYRLLFRSKKRISESYDIKKVEVSLPVFSQYVTLRLVCLQTLINTFISDKTIAHSSEKLKKYMKEYKAVALGSARYISWAIKQILGSRDCGNVKYPVLMQQMKRFHVNTHIRSQGKIPWRWGKEYPKISYKKGTVVCDPVSKYKCQAEASQAAVDVKPNRDAQLWCMAKQSCQKYFYKVCLLIEKYWRKEVGETAERWTKLASGK